MLFIHSVKINKSFLIFLGITICILLILISVSILYPISLPTSSSNLIWSNTIDNSANDNEKKYIKWVDFSVTYDALDKTSKLDINSHNNNEEIKYNWIELLSYLACKYGGDFKRFSNNDLVALTNKLKNGSTMEELTKNLKNYSYYFCPS